MIFLTYVYPIILMESFIRTLFTENPYQSFSVDEIEDAILENQDKIENTFIYNDTLALEIKGWFERFECEPEFCSKEQDRLVYYPDVKINKRLDKQSIRISELEKQIKENNKKIEDLTKKLEELSVKDTKKKFFLF